MTIETRFFSTAWWGAAEPISVTAAWQSSDHPWTGTVAGLSFTGISMHSESGMFFYANQSQVVAPLVRMCSAELRSVKLHHCTRANPLPAPFPPHALSVVVRVCRPCKALASKTARCWWTGSATSVHPSGTFDPPR